MTELDLISQLKEMAMVLYKMKSNKVKVCHVFLCLKLVVYC